MKEFTIMELAQKFVGKCDKCPLKINYYDYEDIEHEVYYCALRYSESELETSCGRKHIVHYHEAPDHSKCPLRSLVGGDK